MREKGKRARERRERFKDTDSEKNGKIEREKYGDREEKYLKNIVILYC